MDGAIEKICEHKFVHSYFLPKRRIYEECRNNFTHVHAPGSDVIIHCKFCGKRSDRFSVGETVRKIMRRNPKVKTLRADDAPGTIFNRERAIVLQPKFPDIIPLRK